MRLLLCLLLACASAFGQSFTFRTITFEGAPQYTQADLLSMCGLVPGKTVSQAELESALHKLDDTGLFTSIDYKSDGPALHIKLVPEAGHQARTLHFNNFVLDTPAELDTKLRDRVPLFTGTVPVVGDLQAKLERALEAILKDEGITATVTSLGGTGSVLDYSIASLPVVVGKVLINGVDFGLSPNLTAIRGRYQGQEYLEGISGESLRSNLLDAYQDLGFIDFASAPVAHGKPVVTPARITVDLTGSATPGALYHVAKVDLPPVAPGVSAAELTAAIQLKPGAPASRLEALSTEARVGAAFAQHGYLDQKTSIAPTKDTSAHTVSYALSALPGARYTFHVVRAPELNSAQVTELTQALKLPVGTPFEEVAAAALTRLAPAKALCGGSQPTASAARDQATHQADVVLTCPTH